MGQRFDAIDERLASFLDQQRVFFVASAPAGEGGHVNVSPKGGETFHALGPREVAHVDFVGSGVETMAHVRQNGRITVLFCAFEGPPRIVRLHGRGRVVEPPDAEPAPTPASAQARSAPARTAHGALPEDRSTSIESGR